MLRISVLNNPGVTRFKLEGKLAHEWVLEAANAWATLTALNVSETVTVDLLGVSFVDDLGRQLLMDMHRAGAKLLGAGPLISTLIEEIQQGPNHSRSQLQEGKAEVKQ